MVTFPPSCSFLLLLLPRGGVCDMIPFWFKVICQIGRRALGTRVISFKKFLELVLFSSPSAFFFYDYKDFFLVAVYLLNSGFICLCVQYLISSIFTINYLPNKVINSLSRSITAIQSPLFSKINYETKGNNELNDMHYLHLSSVTVQL